MMEARASQWDYPTLLGGVQGRAEQGRVTVSRHLVGKLNR